MKLHWFWRAALAVTAGAVLLGATVLSIFIPTHEVVRPWIEATTNLGLRPAFCLSAIFLLIPAMAIPTAVYGVLTRLCGGGSTQEKETRCRECGYILRGIPEPRCSECGEWI